MDASSADVARLDIRYSVIPRFLPCNVQVCCGSRFEAIAKDHYHCFRSLVPDKLDIRPQDWDVYPCVSLMLREGNIEFARRFFLTHPRTASYFAEKCIEEHDTLALEIARLAAPDVHLPEQVLSAESILIGPGA